MKCPYCGAINPPNAEFCLNCGKRLTKIEVNQTAEKECPRCHHLNSADSKFCENCGYDFSTEGTQLPESSESSALNNTQKDSVPPIKQPQQTADSNQGISANPSSSISAVNKPSAPLPPRKKYSKVLSVLSIVVLIALMAGTGWIVYDRYFQKPVVQSTAKVTKKAHHPRQKSTKPTTSSSSSKASSSSEKYNTELYSQVKNAVNETMGQIDGDNSVFVSASPE
ncbi:zinc ribbon domain-containing protein [Schleiferilactobacillus perolens]|jgi:beta-lactamase class A|uniref:zinc ribbon domain-containing protein n=1 Tax=Schleiferilactobacillus perolens TaxID=100468 RepID=UPI0023547C65|nr:zinc ribbon domain-containing protein [Schleiferilactobacillus perolens]MCI2172216.1 zinc ribbon domain-containing protein [Schleiferilactobacillus perolens]